MSRSKPGKRDQDSGFSLVETIAAMGILALAAVPLMQLVTDLTRNTAWLENRMLARTVAENVLARALTDVQPRDGGIVAGTETQLGRAYFWTLTASRPVENQTQSLEVAVRADETGDVIARLVTMRAIPGPAPISTQAGATQTAPPSGEEGDD